MVRGARNLRSGGGAQQGKAGPGGGVFGGNGLIRVGVQHRQRGQAIHAEADRVRRLAAFIPADDVRVGTPGNSLLVGVSSSPPGSHSRSSSVQRIRRPPGVGHAEHRATVAPRSSLSAIQLITRTV